MRASDPLLERPADRVADEIAPPLFEPAAARWPGSAGSRIQRTTASPPPVIRRTVWTYGAAGQWAPARGEAQPPVAQPVNIPHGPVGPGDTFDDTDPHPQLFSGSNAKVLGEPNRVWGYQDASAREVGNLQAALARAKLKLHKGITAVQAGVAAVQVGPVPPQLVTVMEVGFNVATDTPQPEVLRILLILEAGLLRLRDGLASAELPLVSASRMRMYGIADEPADCSGWVPRGITEGFGRGSQLSGAQELTPVSGEIHLRKSDIDKDDFDTSLVADTIIHEAAHKFLGAWDYSYIGVPGTVTRGLQNRSGVASRAAGQGPWDGAKEASVHKAYAQVAQAIVIKGLAYALPEALDRGRPEGPTDSTAQKEAKKVWALVSTWGSPMGPPPDPVVVEATIGLLQTKAALEDSAKKELRAFLADKERYLAVEGNALNVKGHDVLFALSTGFLLKNADSWTELALKAAG
jgi:hypothetical protein